MKLLITGGCGFLGSNLAAYGLQNDYDITVYDNLSRLGSGRNLEWLKSLGNFRFVHGDVRCRNDVENVLKSDRFDAVFHVAGQVAMTTSIENPYGDFETNVMGTLNVLETIRKYSPETGMLFSSTNKVYGDLEQFTYVEKGNRYVCEEFPQGFPESLPLDFRTPYGCSKGAADQYLLDYARVFGLKTVVFRHSSMCGSRQFASYDQGWIGWFVQKAVEKRRDPGSKPFEISGNGKQVRDILHAEDMIRLYYSAFANIQKVAGNAFNIGGTVEQSLSLLELFKILEELLGIKMTYINLPPRKSDQKVFIADTSKINRFIGWEPQVHTREGIEKMVEWINHM